MRQLGGLIIFLAFGAPLAAQEVRDLYINDLERICARPTYADSVLQQMKAYGINQITLFDFFRFRGKQCLEGFLQRAREQGVVRVSAGLPHAYFAPHATGELPPLSSSEALVFENEFWLEEDARRALKLIGRLQKEKRAARLQLDIYFGWFGQGVDENQMALRICRTFDRILLHHYRQGADYPYLNGRLETFAQAARRYSGQQNIVVRMHIGPQYQEDLSPERVANIYAQLEQEFRQAAQQNPALRSLRWQGWQIFNSHYLLEAVAQSNE